jgi:hypothetical protein
MRKIKMELKLRLFKRIIIELIEKLFYAKDSTI